MDATQRSTWESGSHDQIQPSSVVIFPQLKEIESWLGLRFVIPRIIVFALRTEVEAEGRRHPNEAR